MFAIILTFKTKYNSNSSVGLLREQQNPKTNNKHTKNYFTGLYSPCEVISPQRQLIPTFPALPSDINLHVSK